MKNVVKNICIVIFISWAFIACSTDDSNSSSGLSGVPTGEVVSVEFRDSALTGFSDEQGS